MPSGMTGVYINKTEPMFDASKVLTPTTARSRLCFAATLSRRSQRARAHNNTTTPPKPTQTQHKPNTNPNT